MTFLLDAHTLVWAVLSPSKLSRSASAVIADENNEILVSASSAWEIGTKVRLGKMPEATAFEAEFQQAVEEAGYTLLSIDPATALRAARFTTPHRDPFDRIIAAHALTLDVPIISIDAKLDQFGIRRIW